MNHQKIVVYLNNHASQSELKFNMDDLKKYFFRYELDIKQPQTKDELIELVENDCKNNVDYIFSLGGDGTMNTIAQVLVNSKTKLLVMPGGTANDFAREIGTNNSLKKISSFFYARSTRMVDTIKVNEKYLFTNGGIGLAQEVAQNINNMRAKYPLTNQLYKKIGKNIYSFSLIDHLLRNPLKIYSVFMESQNFPLLERRINSPLILINNQSRLAGRFVVAPQTVNNDGKFNVTIFLHNNRFDFIKAIKNIFFGMNPKEDKNILVFETNELTLTNLNEGPLTFFGDGELWNESPVINIKLNPHSLEVYSKDYDDIPINGLSLEEIPHII